MKFFFGLWLFISSVSQAQNNSCDSLIGTCDFYLCQEKQNPCGLDGYNLGFGYKYCNASLFKLRPKMSADGQIWVDQTIQCLQEKNLENALENSNAANSCEAIQSNAFAAHPDCYVQAGYCQLAFFDKLRILNLLKSEIFKWPVLLQGFDLLKLCGLNSARL